MHNNNNHAKEKIYRWSALLMSVLTSSHTLYLGPTCTNGIHLWRNKLLPNQPECKGSSVLMPELCQTDTGALAAAQMKGVETKANHSI